MITMITGATMSFGTTEGFFKKNENSQTRIVITEKYVSPTPLPVMSLSLTGSVGFCGSYMASGTTTFNSLFNVR